MTIDPQWSELDTLFDAALDCAPEARPAFIAGVRARDAALGDRLARMIDAHDHTGPLDLSIVPEAPEHLGLRVAAALHDRYVIDEELGTGGMAAVFLAHERKHDRKVVVKVLQPGLAAAIGTSRFLDEVRITARLAHPHIVALIDSGATDGILYYVMPYVGGETLRDRLTREGALPLHDALALLRDVADALAHAHAAGIVHRDLKPENVLCVGGHAFLIDFGVAKLEADVSTSRVTMPGHAIGTPGYMAPEQAAGEQVDHRADIYAWGLLARELLGGRRALEAPLGVVRADVPRGLVAMIDACVALDPFERPQSASALVAALDDRLVARPKRWRWRTAAATAALVGAIGVLYAISRTWVTQQKTSALRGPIAVAPLVNETADTALSVWGRLAGDWITQGLHESGLMSVVPWSTALLASEHHAQDVIDGKATVDLPEAMRRETGAGLVITGSYYRRGDSLQFQVSVSDARTGTLLIAPAPVIVPRDSAAPAIRELRERIMGAIALQLDGRIDAVTALTTRPPTYDAYREFDRGLAHFNRYEYEDARRAMIAAWQLDSTFVPAIVFAALAAANDGDWGDADSLVRLADRHRTNLNVYYASLADYLAAYINGDRQRALREVQHTGTVAPGSRAGYISAFVMLQLNQPEVAESVLASLDPDRGTLRDWPAYWSQRAYANHLLGRHDVELRLAREMRARHPAQRVTSVIEARALAAAGHIAALDSVLDAAAQLAPDVYWSRGAMLVVAGEELDVHQRGDPTPRYQEAVAWLSQRLAITPADRSHREWLADALLKLGRRDSAEVLLTALDHDRPGRIGTRGQLAVIAAYRGDRTAAARWLGEAQPHLRGEQLLYRARVAAILGEKQQALKYIDDALQTGVENWHWSIHRAWRDLASLHTDARFLALVDRSPH